MTLDCHGSDMTRFLDQISSHLGGQGQLMEEACVVARAAEPGDLALDLGPFLQRDYPKAGRKEAGRGRGWNKFSLVPFGQAEVRLCLGTLQTVWIHVVVWLGSVRGPETPHAYGTRTLPSRARRMVRQRTIELGTGRCVCDPAPRPALCGQRDPSGILEQLLSSPGWTGTRACLS